MILGIDPGLLGGLGCVEKDPVKTFAVPFQTLDGCLDLHWLVEWITKHKELIEHCVVEKVHAIFGSSAGATFTFGRGVGSIEGVLSALHIPFSYVQPKKWQKDLDIVHPTGSTTKEKKEKHLLVCKKLFPYTNLLATHLSTKPHSGMVDALLVSEWARRNL